MSEQLQLAPEVVAALESEKASLLAGLKEDSLLAKLRSKRDSAREAKPRDLDAIEAAEAEERQPAGVAARENLDAMLAQPAPAAAPLTFDPATLATLTGEAKAAQDAFTTAEEDYLYAKQALAEARERLFGYLREHGVPLQ